jgi:hypothetical protein
MLRRLSSLAVTIAASGAVSAVATAAPVPSPGRPLPTFDRVVDLLDACSTCHATDSGEGPRFDPISYPFFADPLRNQKFLRRLWGALNRWPDFTAMPGEPFPAFTGEELERVRTWIEQGAMTTDAAATITGEQIQAILAAPEPPEDGGR